MRIKSHLWVKAYIRTCFTNGVSCAVVRKGDSDAGQIYIKCNHLDGTFSLQGPALGFVPSGELNHRFEEKMPPGTEEDAVDVYLNKQIDFDGDIWIVEIESKSGEVWLEP